CLLFILSWFREQTSMLDLAQAIHFHLKINGLWIYAATWEFDQNPNDLAHSNELKLEKGFYIKLLPYYVRFLNSCAHRGCFNEPVFHIQAIYTHVSKLGVYSIVLMHELGPLSCNNCSTIWMPHSLLCPHSLSKFGQKLTH
ncbi:hypothetical protein ACJX0J_006602, partial [Zea mays]